MEKLNVHAIFDSIDGEANGFLGAGQLTTFIRLKNCNLSCQWCDTLYAQSSTPENWMTIEEILEQVHFKKVTITGGEPLLQQEAVNLLCCKLMWKYHSIISIETNGTIKPNLVEQTWVRANLRYILDYKLPSSGCEKDMKEDAFATLRVEDVIKFVIADWTDYNRAIEIIDAYPEWIAKKVFSPAMQLMYHTDYHTPPAPDMDWPRQLVEMMIRDKVDATFSLQLHKIVWPGATEER